ncbi:MAG TPA: HAD family phosphatase [Frankiaceae bacterium]|nr:HAD family phosphatase [Frankiaceae bacterium]
MLEAIVFDMDGVIVESEQVWDEVRQVYVEENGGRWSETASRDQMGMSTPEWSTYLVEQLGVPGPPEKVAEEVIDRVAEQLGDEPPLIDGAVHAVRTVARRYPVGVASSSPPRLIAAVLAAAGIADLFAVTVSSEEVPRGKPAPDVYLEVCRRMGVDPARAAAIEDSSNGLRAAVAAGMIVLAVPNREYRPADDALQAATRVLEDISAVPEQLAQLG